MEPENTRRSDRVALELPIQVSGMDEMGRAFIDDSWTLHLSRHGASIFLTRKLSPHEEVTIRRMGNGKTTDARIVGLIGEDSEGYSYGIEFLDTAIDFWEIEFPSPADAGEAVARMLLECARCRTREVVYLTELEWEVFDANKSLSRACKRCMGVSLWKESHGPEPELAVPVPAQAAPSPAPEPAPAPAPPPKPAAVHNKRKQVRVALKLTACIHNDQLGDEIVTTEDVSKGGLAFKSARQYRNGWSIEVAVPYSQGAGNIFVPARIVNVIPLPKEGLNRYSVAYMAARKP